MENFQSKRSSKIIASIIAITMIMGCLFFISPSPSYAATNKNGQDMEKLKPVKALGLLITGEKVKGTSGFLRDIIYLDKDEMAQMGREKNPHDFGLGNSWLANKRYSSYDNHGTGAYHYTLASGLNVMEVMDTVVEGGNDAVEIFNVQSSDGYQSIMKPSQTKNLKYYAPGDGTGIAAAPPMIAFYKNTNEAENQATGLEPAAGSEKPITQGKEIFIYGQTGITDDNNCHYIKYANAVITGALQGGIRSESNKVAGVTRLKQLMEIGIFQTEYSFVDKGKNIIHKVEGVPLSKVMAEMKIDKFLASYSTNRVEIISEDGSKTSLSKEEMEKSFVSWGFTDGGKTPIEQTSQLAVYMPGTTKGNTVAPNISGINVVDAKGKIVKTVPEVPKPVPTTLGKGSITKLYKSGKTNLVISWKKVSGANGYVLYKSTSKNGKYGKKKTVTSGTTLKYKDTKLKKGKTYYYKIRAYKKANGKTVYGSLSSAKGIKR
ncbi:MAG: fibronectin type III domain-containing protein [Anaerovoracaceae bacterium]